MFIFINMKRSYADMEKDYQWFKNGQCIYCHKNKRDDYKMDPSKLAAHAISNGHKTAQFRIESDPKCPCNPKCPNVLVDDKRFA